MMNTRPRSHGAREATPPGEDGFALLVERVQDYAIFMLDPEGRVATWNQGAQRIKGYTMDDILGEHISRFYRLEDVERGLPKKLLAIAEAEGRVEDEGWRVRKDGSQFWADVVITALRDNEGKLRGFGKVTRDLTERRRSDLAMRDLSGQLLKVQDEERRRIARELHDSTSPLLTALIAKLYAAKQRVDGLPLKLVGEGLSLAEDVSGFIRSVAFLLHPPLLDEVGLLGSLQFYVNGYAARTGIRIETDFPRELGRLPDEVEIALFRVAQECLANVIRHAGTRNVRIRMAHDGVRLSLIVSDSGRGISATTLAGLESGADMGIGLRGLRERLRQLGGTIDIRSDAAGTTVEATIPVKEIPRGDPLEV